MIVELSFIQDKDTGNIESFDLNASGFIPTWGVVTQDEKNVYLEFDIVHRKSGMDTHIQLPYTQNFDLLETMICSKLICLRNSLDAE